MLEIRSQRDLTNNVDKRKYLGCRKISLRYFVEFQSVYWQANEHNFGNGPNFKLAKKHDIS